MFGSRDKLKPRLPPRVPDGERVYAVGDIHGRADLLAQLQDQILADTAGRAAARQTVGYMCVL
jgi:serine/threonine protein phosphatase 1